VAEGGGATPPAPRPAARPFGVVLLTLLLLAYAALSTPHVLDRPGFAQAGLARVIDQPDLREAAQLLQAVVAAVAALGLWLRRRWGWVGAMALAGPTLALEVLLYFRGAAAYSSMAVATLIALYLSSADVQRHFFHRRAGDAKPQDVERVPA
jgi:hypothetical protein